MTMQPVRRPSTTSSSLESIFWFASSNFVRQGLSAATTLLRPVLMSPELFGLFTALRLIPTYAEYLHLGSRDAMRYLIPMHEARGEHQAVGELRATVLGVAVAGGVLVALILFGLALFVRDWQAEMRIGLAICAVTVLLAAFYNHFFTELKGFQAFREVGLNNYLSAVLHLVFNAVLILWLGFYGALLALAAVLACLLIYVGWRGFARFHMTFRFSIFKAALLLGGPTMLFDVALLMMRSADRVIIVDMLGYQQLGYYGLGAMVMGYLMHIPGATREVMEARLFQDHAATSAADAFRQYVLRPMVMIGLTMPVLIGPVVLFLPAFIPWLLPDYAAGVPATQVLMLGGYFLAVSFPLRGILAANGWQVWGALLVLGSVVLHVGLSIMLVRLDLGIVGVALSAGVAYAAAGLALFLFTSIRLPALPAGVAAQGLLSLLPFPLMLAVLYGLMLFGAWLGWPAWPTLLAQLALYGVALLVGAGIAAWSGLLPVAPLRRRLSRVLGLTSPPAE